MAKDVNKISSRQGAVVAVDDDSDFGQPLMVIFFLYLISLEIHFKFNFGHYIFI